ncbi:hypothetical protein Poli38472_013528 [Pythium oligandrum]|uniref:Uncharacterized protein n=1 Tax=Pythium oligandrum TaxID=41045 RepID=A0A8K1C7V1_PYTOL|nr:hypothetical protein Poli38472_013528 [Pythium oligandrum]|eukprot:TMW58054.1 hypothetical protein Poli38472_013528 [Pythium oligandrum]
MSWFRSKIKLVAARASDIVAQAADIVAPPLYESRVDEFHHRWMTVSRFLETVMNRDVDAVEQRRLLLESHTRDSLQKLVLLIYAEENATDRQELTATQHPSLRLSEVDGQTAQESTRACLEYLLERQIIPHLCDVGRRDQPCGIMSLTLQFVGALLGRVNHPILPTREVHMAVVGLIQAATKKEVEDPVVRKCLITLLNILWKKLRGDPVQTEFFFANRQGDVSDLVLFTGLLPHMYAVGKIGEKCREALVIAASMHEEALCRFVLRLTPFCHYAVNGVISAFDALPRTLPDKVTPMVPNTAVAVTRGIDSELQFLATRLRFCCTLAMVGRFELVDIDENTGTESRSSITNEILAQFRARFLEGPLLDALMDTSEATARTGTLYTRIMLEELAACSRDINANPLLLVFVQFLVEQGVSSAGEEATPLITESQATAQEESGERRLPVDLMHRMDSLSSSLSIATMDLFTSLMELQDPYIDETLLGEASADTEAPRGSVLALSPHGQNNSAIWFASRFPDSAVASNAHVWKIQAFDSMASNVDIPLQNDTENSEDQIVSLLSYIADAEYVTCQRAPAVLDDWELSDDEDEIDDQEQEQLAPPDNKPAANGEETPEAKRDSTGSPVKRNRKGSDAGSTSSRTAATRNAMKPLKEVPLTLGIASYTPVVTKYRTDSTARTSVSDKSDDASTASVLPTFFRLVLNRLERVLESSFQENLALSGLISVLAQKTRYSDIVFDLSEQRGAGQSIRSVLEEVHGDAVRRTDRLNNGAQRLAEMRRKLVEENNDAALNDHEAETRLLCGFIILDEILKELCSILFAKERVRSLPVKPEGYYLEPKRLSITSPRRGSTESRRGSVVNEETPQSIGQELEQLIKDAEAMVGGLSTIDPNDPMSPKSEHAELVM